MNMQLLFDSIKVDETAISIMDTGPGMDGSDENSIVKWYIFLYVPVGWVISCHSPC